MRGEDREPQRGHVIGRYALYDAIASGGMATVYYGRLLGPVGFARTVAIKRLHPHYASDPEFASMFLDEARLAARIHHPNVVQTLDVVALKRELILVMEYVRGESLSRLFSLAREDGAAMPMDVLTAIVAGALHGLHAAHEAKSERGDPLDIVHRDVSPQNILVGIDGVPRVIDFGIAKAAGRLQTTRDGQVKGKLAYMAPEQIRAAKVTRRTDVYAVGVVLWEGLTGRRLFHADNDGAIIEQALLGYVDPPSRYMPKLPEALDAITMRALDRDPNKRFQTAREMAMALEKAIKPALPSDVGQWVTKTAASRLAESAERVAEIESDSNSSESGPPSWLGEAAESDTDVDAVTERRPPPVRSSSQDASDDRSGGSQISSISVARPPNVRSEHSSRRSRIMVAAVGGTIVTAALGAFIFTSKSSPMADPPNITPASAQVEATPAPPPESTASALGVDGTAAASASAKPAESTAPTAARTASPVRPKVTPPPKDDCRVKFTIDSTGRKLYKRHCL